MDVARLPISHPYAAGYPAAQAGSHARARAVELVTDVAEAGPARDSLERVVPTEPGEQVIQGEVLERTRTQYSSTHDYLNGRVFDADGNATPSGHARSSINNAAMGAYLSHTREHILPNANRGRQVDYFI